MVAGILSSTSSSGVEIWVSIRIPDVTSRIEKLEQGLGNGLCRLPAIFAHSDQCRPVPRAHKREKDKGSRAKAAIGGNKPVEVRQPLCEFVAHALDAIKGNLAHRGESRNGGGFHIDESSFVS